MDIPGSLAAYCGVGWHGWMDGLDATCHPSSVFIHGPLLTGREKARDGAGVCPSGAHSNVYSIHPSKRHRSRITHSANSKASGSEKKVPAAFGPPTWPVHTSNVVVMQLNSPGRGNRQPAHDPKKVCAAAAPGPKSQGPRTSTGMAPNQPTTPACPFCAPMGIRRRPPPTLRETRCVRGAAAAAWLWL